MAIIYSPMRTDSLVN